MAAEVLWFVDRFGIRGNYYREWLMLLHRNRLSPNQVRTVSLHERLRGTLLTKYGTRKAPTWAPDRAQELLNVIQQEVDKCGRDLKAIVLAAPEALVAIGLSPEHATLSKLRGSVYEVCGKPAIVMLPMSTWFTTMSQKDVQLANYGAGSADYMEKMINARHVESAKLDTNSDTEREDQEDDSDSADDLPRSGSGTDNESGAAGTHGHGIDGRLQSDHGGVGELDSDGDSEEEDQDADEESLDDSFFYVPIVTPIGRFMLTCDVAKLSRIVHGRAGERFPPPKLY